MKIQYVHNLPFLIGFGAKAYWNRYSTILYMNLVLIVTKLSLFCH